MNDVGQAVERLRELATTQKKVSAEEAEVLIVTALEAVPEMWDPSSVAKFLGVHKNTVVNLAVAGHLVPAIEFSHMRFYVRRQVEEFGKVYHKAQGLPLARRKGIGRETD